MGLYDAYLAGLPTKAPFRAFPECQSKASLLTTAIEHHGLPRLAIDIDPDVRDHLEHPPPVSGWVADVQLYGAVCALADGHGYGPAELERWIATLARRLYRQPIYRFLMLVVSPERLIRGTAKRWGAFHRGTELEVRESAEHRVVIQIRRPRPTLGIVQPSMVASIQVAIEEAGGKEVVSSVLDDRADTLDIELTWR